MAVELHGFVFNNLAAGGNRFARDGIGHDDGDLIQPGIQLRQPVDGEFIKIKVIRCGWPVRA
jgi:hypothetical protein